MHAVWKNMFLIYLEGFLWENHSKNIMSQNLVMIVYLTFIHWREVIFNCFLHMKENKLR